MQQSFSKRQTMNQTGLSPKSTKKWDSTGEDSPKMRSSMRQETGLKPMNASERKTVHTKKTLMLSPVK